MRGQGQLVEGGPRRGCQEITEEIGFQGAYFLPSEC